MSAGDAAEVGAYHLAGRAVAAVVLGRPFRVAELGEDGAGRSEPVFVMPMQRGDELAADERTLIEDEVVQLFAAAYAEERFSGRRFSADDRLALAAMPPSDWFEIALSGRTLEAGSDMDQLSERARVLVEDCWQAIAAAARLLLANGRITRAKVVRLVAEQLARADDLARAEHPATPD